MTDSLSWVRILRWHAYQGYEDNVLALGLAHCGRSQLRPTADDSFYCLMTDFIVGNQWFQPLETLYSTVTDLARLRG